MEYLDSADEYGKVMEKYVQMSSENDSLISTIQQVDLLSQLISKIICISGDETRKRLPAAMLNINYSNTIYAS